METPVWVDNSVRALRSVSQVGRDHLGKTSNTMFDKQYNFEFFRRVKVMHIGGTYSLCLLMPLCQPRTGQPTHLCVRPLVCCFVCRLSSPTG